MNMLTDTHLPLAEPLDTLLADVAIRVQLSATNYQLAVQRYEKVSDWIERDGSPLQHRVQLFHPQGSMSIGTTIASKLETDEFDIDLIALLDLPRDTPPHLMLGILEQAIRGESGSRYYDKVERRTRCIQIHYADGMHLDVTPMVQLQELPEKCGFVFHAPQRQATNEDRSIVANPWGFTQWFLEHTPVDQQFREAFAEHARAYEIGLLVEAAETEPVPDQSPVYAKSMAVVALQLIKRFRNVRYDQREGRRPPSVLLSKIVADNAGASTTLTDELIHQASQLRDLLTASCQLCKILDVRNPRCESDRFTDRWPGTLDAQRTFANDMCLLVEKLESIRGECDLAAIQETLSELFGENVATDAVKRFNQWIGRRVTDGRSQHVPGSGRVVLPCRASVVAAGLIAAAPAVANATPKHTYFGSSKPQ